MESEQRADSPAANGAHEADESIYLSAKEGRTESLVSTSSRATYANADTASSPIKSGPAPPSSPEEEGTPSPNVDASASSPPPQAASAASPSPPPDSDQDSEEEEEEEHVLGASLFSVPPSDARSVGVYGLPVEAFEFKNLDSGETIAMDRRYWIKDVDTGRVFVLKPDAAGAAGGGGSAGSSGGGVAAAGGRGGSTSPSMRVADLISGVEVSLVEFEQALGYFKEPQPPPIVTASPTSSGGGAAALAIMNGQPDFGAHTMAQRGMHSISLAAQASVEWIREKAAAAREILTSPRETRPGGSPSFSDPSSPQTGTEAAFGGSQSSFSSRAADGQGLAVKVAVSRKPFKELTDLRLVQTIPAHQGVIWTMRFSKSGRYLATAGQDCVVAVWEVITQRDKNATAAAAATTASSTTNPPSGGSPRMSLTGMGGAVGGAAGAHALSSSPTAAAAEGQSSVVEGAVYGIPVLRSKPVRLYRGHKQDILDVSWSKTNFLLSASMDKTVRLWHVSMDECLRVFKHSDFVTAIDFHPSDDKLFVSGSIDGKVRLWNVPEQRVVSWQDVHDMVTAVAYSRDGRRAVVGSMRGRCRFYGTGSKGVLEYEAQLDVKNKRGQHARGKKVTGLHFAPGPEPAPLLITSNDSRVRLYDGYTLRSKFKGHSNKSTQIKASFSPKGDYVICGSDDGYAYVWATRKTTLPGSGTDMSAAAAPTTPRSRAAGSSQAEGGAAKGPPSDAGVAKEKNSSYEAFQVAQDVVTVALFAPECTHRAMEETPSTAAAQYAAPSAAPAEASASKAQPAAAAASPTKPVGPSPAGVMGARGQVMLAAGYSGEIKIYENIGLPQWL